MDPRLASVAALLACAALAVRPARAAGWAAVAICAVAAGVYVAGGAAGEAMALALAAALFGARAGSRVAMGLAGALALAAALGPVPPPLEADLATLLAVLGRIALCGAALSLTGDVGTSQGRVLVALVIALLPLGPGGGVPLTAHAQTGVSLPEASAQVLVPGTWPLALPVAAWQAHLPIVTLALWLTAIAVAWVQPRLGRRGPWLPPLLAVAGALVLAVPVLLALGADRPTDLAGRLYASQGPGGLGRHALHSLSGPPVLDFVAPLVLLVRGGALALLLRPQAPAAPSAPIAPVASYLALGGALAWLLAGLVLAPGAVGPAWLADPAAAAALALLVAGLAATRAQSAATARVARAVQLAAALLLVTSAGLGGTVASALAAR